MGTRHLVAVMDNGEYKIAQYGQWDGYPEGAGAKILEFLSSKENVENLKLKLHRVRFIDSDGIDKEFIESYEANAPEWSNDPDNRTPEQIKWFKTYASRDIGGKILENVANSEESEMLVFNRIDFAGDSLFCEWAYVIDFDKEVLEVYSGFNHEDTSGERFGSKKDYPDNDSDYHPVKLIKSYSLNSLPDSEVFISDFDDEDE